MPATKKSWQEKLHDDKGHPTVSPITGKMSKKWGTGTMVIPAPMEVDEIMRRVRKGKLITINEIREQLQQKHQVDVACPITTGIFAWIAADEAEKEGRKRITPYWRTLKTGGELNGNYPGGIEALSARLEAEGFEIIQKGKKYFVENYEQYLMKS